jgi:hypothetical protein
MLRDQPIMDHPWADCLSSAAMDLNVFETCQRAGKVWEDAEGRDDSEKRGSIRWSGRPKSKKYRATSALAGQIYRGQTQEARSFYFMIHGAKGWGERLWNEDGVVLLTHCCSFS